MQFKDYSQIKPPAPVRIPINGKTYEFPGTISSKAWVLLQRLSEQMQRVAFARATGQPVDLEAIVLDDVEYADVKAEVFGSTEAELIKDGVSSDVLKRLFQTLTAYHLSGAQAAKAVWEFEPVDDEDDGEGDAQGEPSAPERRRSPATQSTQTRGSQESSTTSPAAQDGERS